MSRLRVFNTTLVLLIIFVLQETIISRINFPIGGFSLYIACLMVVLAIEDRTATLVFGFIGGLIMDLSLGADTPFGQWALVMTIMGYLFSINKESIGDFSDTPLAFIGFIGVTSAFSILIFAVIGSFLGQEMGGISRISSLIFANTIWTILIMPFFSPLMIKLRNALLSNRER